MSKKILYVASTFIHIKHFHLPYLEKLGQLGYDVHVLGSGDTALIPNVYQTHCVNFEKSMFSFQNIKAAFAIAKIIQLEKFDIVYVHTSLAAFFTRLGVLFSKYKPKLVINMVHGYLFDKNSSAIKKCIMLLAEKIAKPMTDVLMVMNQEDYEIATKHHLCKGNIHFINGVGVDFTRFPSRFDFPTTAPRQALGFTDEDFLLVYTAEFSKRKNQQLLIRVVYELKAVGYLVKLLLLGDGGLMDDCIQLANSLGVQNEVVFAGYTQQTAEYYRTADVCVSSSRSEGLPFNIMEAMSSGLPIVATRVKGHTDLVKHGINGYLFDFDDLSDCVSKIKLLYNDRELCIQMGLASIALSKKYGIENVEPQIIDLIDNEYMLRAEK